MIVISQDVVEKIYPEKTGFEDDRVVYDLSGQTLVEDRRNVTYLVSDTLYQGLTELDNANWTALRESLELLDPGQRDFDRINVTLTGKDRAVEHYVFYEKWRYVAAFALLAFAPVTEVDNAIRVQILEGASSSVVLQSLSLEARKGQTALGHAVIRNSGSLDVLVSPSAQPEWLEFRQSISANQVLRAGESIDLDFDVRTSSLKVQTTESGFLSFHLRDDSYPDCFIDQKATLKVTIHVHMPYSFYVVIFAVLLFSASMFHAYLRRRQKEADSLWIVKKSELTYDDPPEVLGRGTFGLVVSAEYRGTKVVCCFVFLPLRATTYLSNSTASIRL